MENFFLSPSSERQILFLCTGNYYRSRTAEILFNHEKKAFDLQWRAYSGGLSRTYNPSNVGPISPFALAYLSMVEMTDKTVDRHPLLVKESDFAHQDLIIALSEREHRPMIEEFFPGFAEQVYYAEVGDLPLLRPEEALPQIHKTVLRLCQRLADAQADDDFTLEGLLI